MADSAAPSSGRIFISYRREETAYPAGWLYDRLSVRSGGQVIKDIDSIQLGDEFVEVITRAVASCDVLLALVGEEWLTITDADGRRRLDDPDDFVRLEIEAALTRNVRVIPILVDGARIPRADELPPSLAGLVRRQALELSPARFDFDTSRLLKVPGQYPRRGAVGARRRSRGRRRHRGHQRAQRRRLRRRRPEATPHPPRPTRLSSCTTTLSTPRRWLPISPNSGTTAVDLLTLVLDRYPDHPQVADRLTEARRQKQLLDWDADARQAAEQGRWTAAVEALEHIAVAQPGVPDTARRLEHARTQLEITSLQADLRRMHAAGQWTAVIAIDEQLASIDPSSTDPDGLVTAARAELADATLADRYSTGLQQLDRGDTERQPRISSPPSWRTAPATAMPQRYSPAPRRANPRRPTPTSRIPLRPGSAGSW